jgi:hypothetical protein
MPRRSFATAFAITIAYAPSPLAAQGSARIAGVVADLTGAVISGAEISVQEVSTGASRKMPA